MKLNIFNSWKDYGRVYGRDLTYQSTKPKNSTLFATYIKDEKTGNIVGVKAVNQDNELMLITTEGIIIRIKVSDTTLLGRITSGVKLINLDENVTVASIAKVREDKSLIDNADTSELLSEEEEKESAAIAAENAKKASVENTETDDELMKELLERAEADGSEDEEE